MHTNHPTTELRGEAVTVFPRLNVREEDGYCHGQVDAIELTDRQTDRHTNRQ